VAREFADLLDLCTANLTGCLTSRLILPVPPGDSARWAAMRACTALALGICFGTAAVS
jgi:hypothetical protein